MTRPNSAAALRRAVVAVTFAALALGGWALYPEGDTVCPEQGSSSASWPYCAPSEPGGPGPADDPIDPRG